MGELLDSEGYTRAVSLVAKLVKQWLATEDEPRFRFPPREIALVADLHQIGDKLALNDSARELVALLNKRLLERTGNFATVLQLKATLEVLGVPVETCSLSVLGIGVGQA